MPNPHNPIYERGRRVNTTPMNKLLVNWKTTAGGIASLLGGVTLLLNMLAGNDEFTTDQLSIALGLIGTGVAGLMARDADKSSQDNEIRR